ncbi:MAG: hypothetical protein V2J11_09810, partial [Desulfofustis sp.]|nr:hypothetical protein [Desulfofustis sp.]
MFDPVLLKQVVRFATVITVLLFTGICAQADGNDDVRSLIATLSGFADRSSGTPGAAASADFIATSLHELGLDPKTHLFQVPIRRHTGATITINNSTTALQPLLNNVISPQAIDGVLSGPIIYVGTGSTDELGGKEIAGALLLMDFNSGSNWLTAAALGARGIIFVDRLKTMTNGFFQEKLELSPLRLPCFWMDEQQAREIFGTYDQAPDGLVSEHAELRAHSSWRTVTEKNIYCLIEGVDPDLKEELLVIEAFYDSTVHVSGRSPGADEAISITGLLRLAEYFADRPPARSILLLATSGHAQSLHGMREAIWSMRETTKRLDQMQEELHDSLNQNEAMLHLLDDLAMPLPEDEERDRLLLAAIEQDLKFVIDRLSKELMGLRLKTSDEMSRQQIKRLADKRFALRRLSWATSFHDLPES